MLHKCANPPCSRLFRKMNEGKLFQLSRHSARAQGPQYFWLCDACVLFFTLAVNSDSIVKIVPLRSSNWAKNTIVGESEQHSTQNWVKPLERYDGISDNGPA